MNNLGAVDVAILPIGGKFTMSIHKAVDAAIAIEPKVVIPVHRFKADPEGFANIIREKSNISVIPLKIGETYQI